MNVQPQNAKSAYVKSFDWLESHLADENLRIVDASWFLPAQQRNAREEFEKAHIPGAVFFDQDAIIDPWSDLPHALPTPEIFADAVGSMGISENNQIIIYDALGMFTAPRVWWMFKIMGAREVYVLDGGFDQWKRQERPITDQRTIIAPTDFETTMTGSKVAMLTEVKNALNDKDIQIVDARGAGRFSGQEPEPREGMRAGHMPGAINLPFSVLSHNGALKPLDELRAIFDEQGVDLEKPTITSCGSGVTAAVIALALQSLGHDDTRLYDGSWSEWGARTDTPVVKGD